MHGTTSNQDGFFELSTEGYYGQEIVISSVGYDSWVIKDFQINKFYKILLKPSAKLLREVVVVPDDMSRAKKEKIFLNYFLGTSQHATQCYIENLEDVILVYYKPTFSLDAYCYEPIIIHNKALGYKIEYFLDSFIVNKNSMFYQGNFLFEEEEVTDLKGKKKIEKRRRNAYYGSRMHFFRVLWSGDVGNIHYILEAPGAPEFLMIDSLVTEEYNGIKYMMPNNYRHIVIS